MIANDVLKCEFKAVKTSPRPIRDMLTRCPRGADGRSEACPGAKRRRKKAFAIASGNSRVFKLS